MAAETSNEPTYSRFACIGAGFSGIAVGATLKRWYGITDVRIFERNGGFGGTWWMNQYPGAACDVPSALYSFSFETNPEWSRITPGHKELRAYQCRVAAKYDLFSKTTFNAGVERCEWIEERARWRLTVVHHLDGSGEEEEETEKTWRTIHECQFLYSGTGQLGNTPRKLDVPGISTFRGPVVHSMQWPHQDDPDQDRAQDSDPTAGNIDFLRDKNVVVFGNGCSGAQIIPVVAAVARRLTHVVRARHWIFPPIDNVNKAHLRWQLRYVPFAAFLQRFIVFLRVEAAFLMFGLSTLAGWYRARARRLAEGYMRAAAPAEYLDLLLPDYEVGCKRRVYDTGYLDCLHRENVALTGERAVEVLPGGVRLEASGVVEADAIVLATGFVTDDRFLGGIEVLGRGGKTLKEHWEQFGGPEAYNCSAMSGFPNFFLLTGPNTVTGHTSVVMAIENSLNYSLRVIKPVLDDDKAIVNVNPDAEKRYSDEMQADHHKTVFFSGCRSWYIGQTKDGRPWNASTYSRSQGHFWYRCLFPAWGDWEFSSLSQPGRRLEPGKKRRRFATAAVVSSAVVAAFWGASWGKDQNKTVVDAVFRLLARLGSAGKIK